MDAATAPLPAGPAHARPARPADLPALVELLDRCSDETIYRRFHGASGRSAARELERIAHPTSDHRSWVVEVGGTIRGTATLAWGRDGVPEAAFLVEDGWFRRGLGRTLFGAVAGAAVDARAEQVLVVVQADNERARRFLRSVAPGARTAFSGGGELEMVVPVVRPSRRSGTVPRTAPSPEQVPA